MGKYKVKNITGKTISFDFDGTLSDDFDDTFNSQKEEIKDILNQYRSLGNKVFIVTKRYSAKNGSLGKVNEHIDVYKLGLELGLSDNEIFFTERNLKGVMLSHLNVDIHFENSEYELHDINTYSKKTQVILITDPYWRDLIY